MRTLAVFVTVSLLGAALSANVTYHVWNQPIPTESNGNPRQTFWIPNGQSFGDIMDDAAKQNNLYRFEYIKYDFGRYITSIGGVGQDPGNDVYWMLYEVDAEPNPANPPADEKQTPYGPDGMVVNSNHHFLWWRKNINTKYEE